MEQEAGAASSGAGPAGEPSDGPSVQGCELMPFDDGSMSSDKAQSSAMNLVINFADPLFAAGTAVFGLGLLVMPLLARINNITEGTGFADIKGTFSYSSHGETNTKQTMRLFTESELRQRFGLLDAAFLGGEIAMSTTALDDYMEQAGVESIDDEVSRIQKWRDKANTNMKALQKRSALAFLGLPPEATEGDINKMYKKMAFELHPDRGGDTEKFKELQEMKERLAEIDKEDEDKKDDVDPEDEEAKKEKEEEQKKEEEEKSKLPPDERSKKLRMEVHDNTVRLWQKAKKAKEEIIGEKDLKGNSQPALNILRQFVERFVNAEIKTLRMDDVKGAEAKLRKFLKQGAEIIAVAALHDVQSTLHSIAMTFNYRICARCAKSPEIQRKCAALLEAVSEVPVKAEAFIKDLEEALADQQERDKRIKEERAAAQKEREAKGDFRGDAAEKGAGKSSNAQAKATSSSSTASDPFGDFNWESEPKAKKPPEPKAEAKAMGPVTAIKKKEDDEKSAISAAVNNVARTGWDPGFDHPYAGALKSNGTGIYCRPCQRWIMTYEYNTEVFKTHVERVHPNPVRGYPS